MAVRDQGKCHPLLEKVRGVPQLTRGEIGMVAASAMDLPLGFNIMVIPGAGFLPLPAGSVALVEAAFSDPINHSIGLLHWSRGNTVFLRRAVLCQLVFSEKVRPGCDYVGLVGAFESAGHSVKDIEFVG